VNFVLKFMQTIHAPAKFFEIPHDYEKGLYTYSFTFVSDKNYLGVGNSIIEVSRHNCCIEGTELRGFVVVK